MFAIIALVGLVAAVLIFSGLSVLDVSTPGGYLPSSGVSLRNETGATIAYGEVAVVDATQTQSENNSVKLGQEGLTPVTTANLKLGKFAVNVGPGVADHANGRFCIEHGALVQVSVDNSAILKGSPLKGANGTATLTLAGTTADRAVARALEANSSTAGLIWCEFYANGYPTII